MGDTAFGRYLRDRRLAAGISMRKLAERLRVSHVYLGEVERGVRAPLKEARWAEVARLVPGVTVDELRKRAWLTRPVQLDLSDAPPAYQDLGVALARRIEQRNLSERDVSNLRAILEGDDDDE